MKIIHVLYLVALACGVTSCASTTSAPVAPVKTDKIDLTVVSYNIHAGVGMDKKHDLERIAGVLRAQNPDVVLLQEVDNKTKRSGNVDQPAEFARLLGMHVYYAQAMPYDGGLYGNAILSKYPLENTRTLALTGAREPRSAAFAQIVKDGRRVALIGVHLDNTARATHDAHVKQITDEAKKYAATNAAGAKLLVIFGGDFNADEKSSIWEILRADWAIPEKQGARGTIPSTAPKREIDWFLTMPATPSSLSVQEYKVIAEPMASDHRPILLKVSL